MRPRLDLRRSSSRPRLEHMSEPTANDDRSAQKDPSDWVTGDEPATGAQKSYLSTLARQAQEDVPAELTKAEASQKIEELKEKTGR